jgi:hypothetical protein
LPGHVFIHFASLSSISLSSLWAKWNLFTSTGSSYLG